jgi:hypothetical protein
MLATVSWSDGGTCPVPAMTEEGTMEMVAAMLAAEVINSRRLSLSL